MSDIVSIFYPENGAGGFSRCDGTIQFYQRVHGLLRPDDVVLDFGAGRGAAYYQDPSLHRKGLRNLRGQGKRVTGVDVDPIVSTIHTLTRLSLSTRVRHCHLQTTPSTSD